MLGRWCTQRGPRRVCVGQRLEPELALAVVAKAPGLEDCRGADRGQRLIQFGPRADGGKLGGLDAAFAEQGFLGQPILRYRQRFRQWPHDNLVGQHARGFGRNVLEVERHRIDLRGKRLQLGVVRPFRHQQRRHVSGAGIRQAVHHPTLHPQRGCGQRQHAGELPATQDAQHGRLARGHNRGSDWASTAWVWCSRQAASAVANVASCSASTAAASNPAFTAPALPIASVPTGTPAGICAIDSSESMPFNALDCIGTPNTGNRVLAASMPGRCAAPPAPAMMTWIPRVDGLLGITEQKIGRAVRRYHLDLVRHAQFRQHAGRVLHGFPIRTRSHHHAHARRCANFCHGPAVQKPLLYGLSSAPGTPVKPAMDKRLLDILCCPVSKTPVRLLNKRELEALNAAIGTGSVDTVAGAAVKTTVSEALITTDHKVIYRVQDGIPVMLPEEGIGVVQLVDFPATP